MICVVVGVVEGLVWFCFFNDTATTEIYTYLHTLSLHDALPISRARRPLSHPRCSAARGATARSSSSPPAALQRAPPPNAWPNLRAKPWRSEEHTSELQSLMRISYAVFCLKKKTHLPHSPHHPYSVVPMISSPLDDTYRHH